MKNNIKKIAAIFTIILGLSVSSVASAAHLGVFGALNNQGSNATAVVAGATVPTITVISPNGGERIEEGRTLSVTWNQSTTTPDKVFIGMSQGSEKYNQYNLRYLGSPASKAGLNSFSWNIPYPYSLGDYKIVIRNILRGDILGESNAPFSITKNTPTPMTSLDTPEKYRSRTLLLKNNLSIVSQNKGENVEVGNKKNEITFNASGIESVSIALYKDDLLKKWLVKDASGKDIYVSCVGEGDECVSGRYKLTLDSSDVGSGYKIYIIGKTVDGSGYIDDKSAVAFSITGETSIPSPIDPQPIQPLIKCLGTGCDLPNNRVGGGNENIDDTDEEDDEFTCLDLKKNLRKGSTDAKTNGKVTLLQNFLNSAGYLNSPATGIFDQTTFEAVQSLQKKSFGFRPTGFVGKLTREKIRAITCDLG